WEDGGFGQPNEGGGPPLHTLADWLTTFDSSSGGAFSSATLVSVEMGMGSYQPSQTGYFDDVAINGTAQPDTTYNFEPVGVPLPASAWSGLALLGGLGLFNCVKRRSMQSV
ncbi:MAG TPA: hypothetical protein VG722_05680, partial [Tepidisphaeraceae bacterium]|nr:hypothetical protein [Tepidisphaeraceae bacterium]